MDNFITRKLNSWLFDYRKKRAIKQADQLAKEQRLKQLVLVYRGKPVVLSMQRIKYLIRTKQLKRTADFYREKALYTAMPPTKKG